MKFSKITLFGGIMFAMALTISGCHSNPDASETDTKSMEKSQYYVLQQVVLLKE